MIAIKNADGTLVPVIKSTVGADQTVALSLVHSHQKRAEILLFELPDTEQAAHVRELPQTEAFGKLVLRRLPDNPFGEIEIQARLTIDPEFNIHVVAGAIGEKTVSGTFRIPSLGTSSMVEVPIYEEEDLEESLADQMVAPEIESETFIDDPDDTDWGFDELANPEEEEILANEAHALLDPPEESEPGEPEGDAFGLNESTKLDDDTSFQYSESEESDNLFDMSGMNESLELENSIDSLDAYESAEEEHSFDTYAADGLPEAAQLSESEGIEDNDDYLSAETLEQPRQNVSTDAASVGTTWSGQELFLMRASIVFFAVSLIELGVFLFLRMSGSLL